MISILIVAAVVAAVVAGSSAWRDRRPSARGQEVRRFFLFLVLLVATLVTVSGAFGVLGRLLERPERVAGGSSDLALALAALLVGAPILAVLARTARRRIAADAEETESAGWSLFITVGSIVTLIAAMFGAYGFARFTLGVGDFDGYALAQGLTWGAAWAVLWRIDRRLAAPPRDGLRHLVGALIGLGVSATAIGGIVAAMFDRLLLVPDGALVVRDADALRSSFALLVVGGPVWFAYWVRTLGREHASFVWRLQTVLVGVAGGLVTWLVSASTLTYLGLVWWIGDPSSELARRHFEGAPSAAGALVAGLIVWWYHRALVASGDRRSDLGRVYVHVMCGGGLLAAAAGTTLLVVAAVDAATGATLVRGERGLNGLILATILLAVGGSVWWGFWRGERAVGDDPTRGGQVRRVYLVSVLGVTGLAALGSAIATLYQLLDDLLGSGVTSGTLRSMRYPLGILLSSAAAALYHVPFLRERAPTHSEQVRLGRVVLVGPADAELTRLVHELGARHVESWATDETGGFPHDEVLARLAQSGGGDVVVTLAEGTLRVRRATRGPRS